MIKVLCALFWISAVALFFFAGLSSWTLFKSNDVEEVILFLSGVMFYVYFGTCWLAIWAATTVSTLKSGK